MSHFTVLVITKDGDYARALAPYQENNMGDCPEEFLEFNDTEDEYAEEYANEGTDYVVLADGSLGGFPWADTWRTDGNSRATYYAWVAERLKNLNPSDHLAVVDCHI